MSNPNTRKSCVVPKCTNTTTNAPKKLFILVPMNVKMRKKWLQVMKRLDPFGDKSMVYCCEDHFDLPNDMENYIKYRVMGTVSQVRMKPGCVPTRFECQADKGAQTSNSTERPRVAKKRRKILIGESLTPLPVKSTRTKRIIKTAGTPTETSESLLNLDINTPMKHVITVKKPTQRDTAIKSIRRHVEEDSVGRKPRTNKKQRRGVQEPSETQESQPSDDTNYSTTRTRARSNKSAALTTDKRSEKDDLLIESIEANGCQTCEYNNTSSRSNKRRRKLTSDVKLPEAEEIIVSVYKFLQAEYEFLKDYIGDICDLSPLTNVLKRTADACGVRECTVTHVVRKTRPRREVTVTYVMRETRPRRGLSAAGLCRELAGGQSRCGDSEIEQQDDSSIIEEELNTTDSVDEPEDNVEEADDVREEQDECEVEAPNMDIDDYEVKPLDPLKTEPVDIKTEFTDLNPYSIIKENSSCGIPDIEQDDIQLTGDESEERVKFDCEEAVEVKTESTDVLYSNSALVYK